MGDTSLNRTFGIDLTFGNMLVIPREGGRGKGREGERERGREGGEKGGGKEGGREGKGKWRKGKERRPQDWEETLK